MVLLWPVGGFLRSSQPGESHRKTLAKNDPVLRSRSKDQLAASAASDMAVSASPSDHRSAEPSLVRGRDLHPDAQGLPVSRRDHGLVQPKGSGVEAVEHDGC